MDLISAIQECREGCFVTHDRFDSYESMHMYKGHLYYEDGAKLTGGGSFDIFDEDWAVTNWDVKYEKDEIDQKLLIEMHINSNGLMLRKGSYEDCILNK